MEEQGKEKGEKNKSQRDRILFIDIGLDFVGIGGFPGKKFKNKKLEQELNKNGGTFWAKTMAWTRRKRTNKKKQNKISMDKLNKQGGYENWPQRDGKEGKP